MNPDDASFTIYMLSFFIKLLWACMLHICVHVLIIIIEGELSALVVLYTVSIPALTIHEKLQLD